MRGGGISRETKQTGAFTLLELLVSIAIIVLLSSLLLAPVSRSKGRAQSIHCISNLRQLTIAATLYSEEHNSTLPPRALTNNRVQALLPYHGAGKLLTCTTESEK